MLDIVQVTDKKKALTLEPLIREYAHVLEKGSLSDNLLVSIFTQVEDDGTLLLVAIKEDAPVGFLWGQSSNHLGESYLKISELYSKQAMMGTKLFERACEWARENGLSRVRGAFRPERAEGLKRLFKMQEEGIIVSLEL